MVLKKKVLITGSCGYIGYPLMIELDNAIGVDNDLRNEWVEKAEGYTHYPNDCDCIHGDLSDRDFVNEILAIHKPHAIIHLASQPSMPYSQINGERALYTQINNISMLLNLLWGLWQCVELSGVHSRRH